MKKCLIVVNTHKDESQNLGRMIQSYLAAKSIESFVFCFDGFSTENPFTGFDFVITLGGDGTVGANKNSIKIIGCVKNKIPVFPVNLGEFGFIASIQKNEWQKELDLFLAGNPK